MIDGPAVRRRVLTAGVFVLGVSVLSACGSSSKHSPASTLASAAPPKSVPATTSAPAAPASSGSIAVTLREYKILPAVTTAKAGHVTFKVTNSGKLKHQFTVIRTNKSAATALSRHNPDDDIPGARGEIASIAPGATKTLVIKHLKPGHYVFVCALPGHYQAGMYEDFTVQ